MAFGVSPCVRISIHAPSRERLPQRRFADPYRDFNPRSLAGATNLIIAKLKFHVISIHAPSRERPTHDGTTEYTNIFQSTLPRGSDFNGSLQFPLPWAISIHAPSRERPKN